ncbi:MAG: hypothetical protein ILO36_06710 [Abditibacteriota bacterium]|nr:hypothetical protein [Abditibacteriota bacterium]
MSKCSVCGNRITEGEPDFYFCPECQKKYHRNCFERFGCTDKNCPEHRGCEPAPEGMAEPPAPLPPREKGVKGALRYFEEYNDRFLICPDCGKKVPVFVWNLRLGCPVKSCLEHKEHLYLRTGLVLLAAALLYAGFRLRAELFLDSALWFAAGFAVLYIVLIHLGMYVKIGFIGKTRLRAFAAGLVQGAAIGALLLAWTLCFCDGVLNSQYKKGAAAMEAGDYAGAARYFLKIPQYRDSRVQKAKAEIKLDQIKYSEAKKALLREDYGTAIDLLEEINGYMDSGELLKEAKYKQAKNAIVSGDLKTAVDTFTDLGAYKDSQNILKTITGKALPALGGAVLDMIRKPSDDEDSKSGFLKRLPGN